ncbi:hypothetical protein PG984_016409 [Apiospora sp. TS-2023a]
MPTIPINSPSSARVPTKPPNEHAYCSPSDEEYDLAIRLGAADIKVRVEAALDRLKERDKKEHKKWKGRTSIRAASTRKVQGGSEDSITLLAIHL